MLTVNIRTKKGKQMNTHRTIANPNQETPGSSGAANLLGSEENVEAFLAKPRTDIAEKIERLISMTDCVEGFAVPGQDSIIDCINPNTSRSWINGQTLEQIRLRYPGAEIVNIEEFCKAQGARQNTPIEWTETTRERYWEMLNVLPPAAHTNGGFLVGEACDHHAGNGCPRFSAFVEREGKFLTASRPITFKEFKAAFDGDYAQARYYYE